MKTHFNEIGNISSDIVTINPNGEISQFAKKEYKKAIKEMTLVVYAMLMSIIISFIAFL